jgi:probable rRNA maturation factor
MLEISCEDDSWPTDVSDNAYLAEIAAAIAGFIEFDEPEMAVVALGNDEQVRTLNKQFRDKDKSTNVLSFPASETAQEVDDQTVFLGDIILARETVAREADEQAVPFEHHAAHLIVHGILHLLGYNHENAEEAEEMEALEIDILATLGIENPYTEELVDAG